MREIAFDLETTGFDPNLGHRIVEIGCVELINRKVTGNYFHSYVNPERDVPKSAEKVHGLTTEFLQDKPRFKEVVDKFLSFIKNDKLVIHNAAFDMNFINFQLKELGKPAFFYERAIDTLEMARKKFPGAKVSLDAMCTRFGVGLEKREKHGALLDSELLAEVYIHLMGGYQASLSLAPVVALSTDKQSQRMTAKKQYRQARAFPPTPEEVQRHTEFMRKIIKST